jgi:hypothetical protein
MRQLPSSRKFGGGLALRDYTGKAIGAGDNSALGFK